MPNCATYVLNLCEYPALYVESELNQSARNVQATFQEFILRYVAESDVALALIDSLPMSLNFISPQTLLHHITLFNNHYDLTTLVSARGRMPCNNCLCFERSTCWYLVYEVRESSHWSSKLERSWQRRNTRNRY